MTSTEVSERILLEAVLDAVGVLALELIGKRLELTFPTHEGAEVRLCAAGRLATLSREVVA